MERSRGSIAPIFRPSPHNQIPKIKCASQTRASTKPRLIVASRRKMEEKSVSIEFPLLLFRTSVKLSDLHPTAPSR